MGQHRKGLTASHLSLFKLEDCNQHDIVTPSPARSATASSGNTSFHSMHVYLELGQSALQY